MATASAGSRRINARNAGHDQPALGAGDRDMDDAPLLTAFAPRALLLQLVVCQRVEALTLERRHVHGP